ncbi:MAG: four helix bundle protein [Planctomycetes bacterium]|nr:four helix bundle protein [Planctomycetota bacterium]
MHYHLDVACQIKLKLLYPANIAVGSERNGMTDFQRFLNTANGSAAELRMQVCISQEVKAFSNSEAKELIQELRSISKMFQAPQLHKKPATVNGYDMKLAVVVKGWSSIDNKKNSV